MRLRILFVFVLLACLVSACSLGRLVNPTVPEPLSPVLDLPANPTANATPNVLKPVGADTQDEPSATQYLATPMSDSPAAGICGEFDGEWVTMTINPDVPDPRCVIIHPDQMLEVVNHRGETIVVTIGNMTAQLADGESFRFEVPFGEYLAPGVHGVEVQPCCGGVLWLQEGQ